MDLNTIYVSYASDDRLIDYLSRQANNVKIITPAGVTYPAVDSHPDIFLCKMGVTRHAHIFIGNPEEIGLSYPHNIRFNAVCLDKYFIHNLKYTSNDLLNEAYSIGLKLIDVKQGYTKCNCVVVDGHSIITADAGILSALEKYPDIDVLPIRQGFVLLDGFEYGFLGGASGRIGDEVIFNGNLSAHPDYEAITQFIETRGLTIKDFPEYPLTDIGSILCDF